jgi:two-component system response regulator FixJ
MTNEGFVHVIDDDLAVRDSLKFLLEAAQLPVRTYESAADFLKALPDVKTGCVITDVRMPDVSGIELLRHVRSTVHSLPVIVITGHGDIPLAVEAMKIGAIDFFEKPFDDDAFLAAVRLALKRKEREEKQESDRAGSRPDCALSAREHQVLGAGGRASQQDHRFQSQNQPPHRRDLSRQRDDQNAGQEPLRARPHGPDRGCSRGFGGRLERLDVPAAKLSQIKAGFPNRLLCIDVPRVCTFHSTEHRLCPPGPRPSYALSWSTMTRRYLIR